MILSAFWQTIEKVGGSFQCHIDNVLGFTRISVLHVRARWDLYRTGLAIAGISIARAIRVLDPIQSLDRYSLG